MLAITGLVLVVFGVLSHLLTRHPAQGFFSFGWYSLAHLVLGATALAAYFYSGSVGSFADFVRQRSTRYGVNAMVYSLLFVVVVMMVNYTGKLHHRRFDLSASGVNSIAQQSREVLAKLEGELRIDAFVEGGVDPVLQELLQAYRYESDLVKYRLIDPQIRPELAQSAAISQVPSIKIYLGDQSTLVTKTDEGTITNGINSLVGGGRKTIYFVEGHGEPDISDSRKPGGLGLFAQALTNQNYLVEKLFLPDQEGVPENASVLVLPAATKAYFPHELDALERYLTSGGRVMVLLEPRQSPDLVEFLAKWGVKVGDDVIIDQQVKLFQGLTLGLEPVVSRYSKHPAVKAMKERSLLSLARSVSPDPDPDKKLLVKPLAFSAQTSWGETDLERLFDNSEAQLGDDDLKGPVPVAVAVSAAVKDLGGEGDGEFEMIVFGDFTFVTNQYFRQLFNDSLALSTMAWLAGEGQLVSIPPRAIRASRAYLSAREGRNVFYLSVLVLPETILLIGLLVWWRRSAL